MGGARHAPVAAPPPRRVRQQEERQLRRRAPPEDARRALGGGGLLRGRRSGRQGLPRRAGGPARRVLDGGRLGPVPERPVLPLVLRVPAGGDVEGREEAGVPRDSRLAGRRRDDPRATAEGRGAAGAHPGEDRLPGGSPGAVRVRPDQGRREPRLLDPRERGGDGGKQVRPRAARRPGPPPRLLLEGRGMIARVEEIARAAGEGVKARFGKIDPRTIGRKSTPRDLVTEADREAERTVVAGIRKAFPGEAILSEEEVREEGGSGPLWHVDPLDGTINFVHGVPVFAVSIARYVGGKPHLGVVFNPIMGELFAAEAGKGATLNGSPIRVTATEELSEALLITGFPYK